MVTPIDCGRVPWSNVIPKPRIRFGICCVDQDHSFLPAFSQPNTPTTPTNQQPHERLRSRQSIQKKEKRQTPTPTPTRDMSDDTKTTNEPRLTLHSAPQSDLTIVLGNEGAETRTHSSSVLAVHSEYIDTMLANDMVESKSHRLTFPDIEPSEWDLMMLLLEDSHVMMTTATVGDAMVVLSFCEKYQFYTGKGVWDRFLSTHLEQLDGEEHFETIIGLSEFGVQYNLQSIMKVVGGGAPSCTMLSSLPFVSI